MVPPSLIDSFKVAKYYTDSHSGFLEQATLALFISQGHYARHVRRIRKACYERYLTLTNTIKSISLTFFVLNRLILASILSAGYSLVIQKNIL